MSLDFARHVSSRLCAALAAEIVPARIHAVDFVMSRFCQFSLLAEFHYASFISLFTFRLAFRHDT